MANITRSHIVLLCAVIAAGALTLVAVSFLTTPQAEALRYKGTERNFWVFNNELPFNESKVGIVRDIFSPTSIIVKKGDTVNIHFFNTEPDERHTFTILDKPYDKINYDIAGGQNRTISFVANQTGVFTYQCIYHMPTMQGQLIVESPTLDELRAQK